MQFSIVSTLLFAASVFGAALPAAEEKRAPTKIAPSAQVLISEYSPDYAFGDSVWASIYRYDKSNSVLVAYQLGQDYSGRTCSLVFDGYDYVWGSQTFQLFKFVPNSGSSFNAATATWNSRTGYRDIEQGGQYKVGTSSGPVHTFPCPSGSQTLNYEIVPSNGEMGLGWTSPAGGLNLYVN